MDVRYDGATITGWGPAALGGKDVLFMPANTPWGKEVHGGVPICWPWFGRREGMPKHGLARYLKWRLVGNAGRTRVELETESTPETLKIWPRPFRLNVVFTLAGPDKLVISFTETNTGTKTFKSAFGIHPYFAVADACAVALDGERLPTPLVLKDIASDGNSHRLEDVVRGIAYTVRAPGKDGWYAWNPGVERTPLCETLAPEEWRKFFCLEPFIRNPRPLAPGKSRTHTLQIYVAKQSKE